MNKKAEVSDLGLMSVFALAFFVFLFTWMFFWNELDTALSGGDIIAGNLNISNFSAQTVGAVNVALLSTGDLFGIFYIFGTLIGIVVGGFLTRDKSSTVFVVVEFIILIFAYIIAVYISNSVETILILLPFADFVITNLNLTSKIMLLLPRIIIITGVLTIIVTYAGIPRKSREDVGGL